MGASRPLAWIKEGQRRSRRLSDHRKRCARRVEVGRKDGDDRALSEARKREVPVAAGHRGWIFSGSVSREPARHPPSTCSDRTFGVGSFC